MHCNGKCFLNAQLNKLDTSASNNTSGVVISKTFIPAFFEITSYPTLENRDTFYKIDNWASLSFNKFMVIRNLDHPPNA